MMHMFMLGWDMYLLLERASQGGALGGDILTHIDGSFDPQQEEVMRWVGENL